MTEAQPLRKIELLAERFSSLKQTAEENHFELRRMARELEILRQEDDDLNIPLLLAVIYAQLGKKRDALALFSDLLNKIPPQAIETSFSIRLRVSFARFLSYNGEQNKALSLLIPIEKHLHQVSRGDAECVLYVYYHNNPLKILDFYLKTHKYHSSMSGDIYISFLLPFYFLYDTKLKPLDAWQLAFDAMKDISNSATDKENTFLGELTLEKLPKLIEDISSNFIHAKSKPNLTENEKYDLQQLEDIARMFLSYSAEDLRFVIPIEHAGRILEAEVTREPGDAGFSAVIEDGEDAIITEADSIEELKEMLREAIELHFDDASAA